MTKSEKQIAEIRSLCNDDQSELETKVLALLLDYEVLVKQALRMEKVIHDLIKKLEVI